MILVRACRVLIPAVALIGVLAVPALANRTHRGATSGHSKGARKSSASHQSRGQRQIDSGRAREIQAALIREHYLTGEPTGEWDADSQAAMSKFQGDQGWQTKLTPDSRALIKLGLGPNSEAAKAPTANQASLPGSMGNAQGQAVGANSLLGSSLVAQ